MTTQVLYPDAATATGLTGTVADIDDDADSSTSDVDYLSSSGAAVCVLIASFPTPSGNPTTGAEVQNFRFRARIKGNAGPPQSLTWRLYNDANATLQSGTVSITSTSFATYTVSWDAANLDVADGSSVRIYLAGGKATNPSSSQWSWEISALEWNVTYSSGVVEQGKPLLFWCG